MKLVKNTKKILDTFFGNFQEYTFTFNKEKSAFSVKAGMIVRQVLFKQRKRVVAIHKGADQMRVMLILVPLKEWTVNLDSIPKNNFYDEGSSGVQIFKKKKRKGKKGRSSECTIL